jgi:hypothetical protein
LNRFTPKALARSSRARHHGLRDKSSSSNPQSPRQQTHNFSGH